MRPFPDFSENARALTFGRWDDIAGKLRTFGRWKRSEWKGNVDTDVLEGVA